MLIYDMTFRRRCKRKKLKRKAGVSDCNSKTVENIGSVDLRCCQARFLSHLQLAALDSRKVKKYFNFNK